MTDMKILYLPLDERPCNALFPLRLAKGSPVEILSPEREVLGRKKIPADLKKVEEFLLENAKDADCAVLSLDTLVYGGILPSRLHQEGAEILLERLNVLFKMKEINPSLKIFAFALIMRCPSYSSGDEEPDYYEICGREIFLTGQVKHKKKLGLIEEEEAERLLGEYAKKTAPYLNDFEKRREVNRFILSKIAQKIGKEIDFLVIPQDDSAPYGYTSMDREFLKGEFKKLGVEIMTYPGADEVGMTLLSRAVCDFYKVTPHIQCVFPKEECKNIIPLYEDRPLKDTLLCQIEAAGCSTEKVGDNRSIALFLNYPTLKQAEVFNGKIEGYDERDIESFTDEIRRRIKDGQTLALADGGYCNGGDLELLKLLSEKIDLFDLAAYAGWNTSSNTLGTTVCFAVFSLLFGKRKEGDAFLAERIYEDVCYMGFARKFVTDRVLPKMGLNYFDAGEERGEVALKVREVLDRFIDENFPKIKERFILDEVSMPWKRMFEVNLRVKENLK